MKKFLSFWLLAAFLFLADCIPAFATSQQAYLDTLVDFQRYAETIWHTNTNPTLPSDSGYWGDGGSSGNGGIRGNCGIAVAYAVMVRALPGNATNALRIERIRQALNYAANSHVSTNNSKTCTDGSKWGWSSATSTDWQTPEWSGSLALACILVQSNLPAQTVLDCRRVVASEADHRSSITPASGYIGDTKAEENGWDSNIPSAAAAWLNTNANAGNWLNGAKQYLANTYTVANTVGDPLASWVTTTTLYPSYALENHGFYHPTYEMVAGMSMGDSLQTARQCNPTTAAQLLQYAEHNVMNVWSNNLNAMVLGSGEFAYPAGLDWELHDYEQNSYITYLAAHFNDPLARWTDGQLAQLVRYRQQVNGNGQFVGPSGGGFYREAVEAKRTAIAWLHWANADFPSGPILTPPATFAHYPDVKVMVHRSASNYVSVSYGSRIMAMIDAAPQSVPTNVYVATPLLPGVIGLGALGNPTGAKLVSLVTNAGGFQLELQLTNGTSGTTEVYINSTGESVGIVEIPYPAAGALGAPVGSFKNGIENDPLCGGSRLLEWTANSATITNRTGASRNISNNWVCVSGSYGLAAGPAGYFNYQAAGSYNRLGAAEDTLQFISQDQNGARYAVWFPGKSAAQTAAAAAQINWSVTPTNSVLTFPGAAGGTAQIIAAVAPAAPPYQAYVLPVSGITASSSQAGFPPTNAVDGNLSDFWVSSGTAPGQGPTPTNPEWLKVTFPRKTAVSRFQVFPRTTNGGYGPKDVNVLLDGVSVYQGTMAATVTLDVSFSPPVYATNGELLITSSYDPANPGNSRNVQVVELIFYERAQPGTFGDWLVRQFSDTDLANPSVGGMLSDPDGDGAANLLEFAMGGDPSVSDSVNFRLLQASRPPGQFSFQFRQRKDPGDVSRQFLQSTNLTTWVAVAPLSLSVAQDLGTFEVLQATFASTQAQSWFRVSFSK